MPYTPKPELIKFKFELDPSGLVIELPAYLEDLSARFSADWTAYPEIGRADPKVVYNNFSKSISLSFKVVAETENRTTFDTFTDLENLSKVTTPYYQGQPGFVGNFVIFTIGNIYVRQVGYVTGLRYSWDNSEMTWDLRVELPYYTNVSMEIAWIGRLMPSNFHDFFSTPA